jgi:PAS domain S-box-containing protein
MKKNQDIPTDAAGLRRRAEEQLQEKQKDSRAAKGGQVKEKDTRTLQELQIHQIELEMQNAELHRTRTELEVVLSKYKELYDFAPVGYFTLDTRGLIGGANLAGAQLLGVEKRLLANKPLSNFIADAAGREIFARHIESVLQEQGPQRCEINLKRKGGKDISGQIQSIAVENSESKDVHILTSVVDITVSKQLDAALHKSHDELEQRVKERTIELQTAVSAIKAMKDQLEIENIYFRQENKMKHRFDHIIGQSDGLKYVLYRAEQVASGDTTVLILGETGTGKELIAAAIHNMSPRRERPLITVNCAALPSNLIESELFGREKGAFTGADTRQIGRFEVANGSTLCLDEIGELPMEVQAKLLRVIQNKEFERLGSSHTVKVDVRIVATTNRDLEEEIRQGRFRQDLYYRLNVFPITVPPLRQRQDDIALMVEAFLARFSRKMGKQITSIQKEAMKALQSYPWPGNVRELENIIERAVILCTGSVLQLTDKLKISSPALLSTVRTLEETERNQILKILAETNWHIEGTNGAAAILGLHPSTLRARMHKLGIARPATKESD